ncbi:hypothetical protein GJ698_02890 [Pseudoduganella sp. FT26W]|uniref:Uncharacterized protein n=1 Tax=Duganella aquatilis TaxID=2666082 RepID=A0A844D4H8_9BURK|nr:hypothetical protein [Duganella aquatilis]MRW83036.1 hypothetical protein [Duganella aquatilis]
MSVLPAATIMCTGGAELSAAERQLLQDFREMNAGSRATMAHFVHRQACRDRHHRAAHNVAGLRLVVRGDA